MFAKDPYGGLDGAGRVTHNSRPLAYSNAQQGYHPDQPYRDYDHPPSHYDVSGSGGYQEPKYRNYDSNPPYENSVPQYDQQPWNQYGQPHSAAAASSQAFDQRSPYSDGHHDPHYTPPLRYDEPPPPAAQQFDGRPRYGKPTGAAPVRYDEPPPPAPTTDLHYDQDPHLNTYPLPPTSSAARSPEPVAATQRPAFGQGPPPPQKTHKPQQYDPTGTASSDGSPTPPPQLTKAQTSPSPSPVEAPQDDPAMRPQSVLTRVKMFENKRSVSVDRARDAGDFLGNKVSGEQQTPLLYR